MLRRLENKRDHVVGRRVLLVLGEATASISAIFSRPQGLGSVVSEAEYEKRVDEGQATVSFDVRLPADLGTDPVSERAAPLMPWS